MPDRLQPVWHFHDPAQLAPGRTGKVKIAPLGGPELLPATQFRQKAEIATRLPGRTHLNRLPASGLERTHQLTEFGGGEVVFSRMRQDGDAPGIPDPADHLLQLRPVGADIARLAGSQIALERLGGMTDHTLMRQHLGKVGPSRHIAAGRRRGFAKQIRHLQPLQTLGNHRSPGPSVIRLLRDPRQQQRVVGIKVEADDMNRPALPQTRQFDTVDQLHPHRVRRLTRRGQPPERVVIGQGKMTDALTGGSGHQIGGCQRAIGRRAVAMQINAQVRCLGYSHTNSRICFGLKTPSVYQPVRPLYWHAQALRSGELMYYAIISEDVDNSLPLRQSARPAHLERLNALKAEGRLLVAGPHPAIDTPDPGEAGFTGSLVIAEFDSLEAAQAWADADPYVEAGVYQRVTVKPFKPVLP